MFKQNYFANRIQDNTRSSCFRFAVLLLWFGSICSDCLANEHSPLADAVEKHDFSMVRLLLEQGCNVNAAQPDGTTALHWAVRFDNLETVDLLIRSNANVNAANRYGVMPLSLACTNGNPEIVRSLLTAGANPNAKLNGGESVLMIAARTGKRLPVESLLESGADINTKDSGKQTAIMWAAAEGHQEVVQILIETGADYQTPLKSGFTPFFFAIREGHMGVTRTFLEHGINVNEQMNGASGNGRSPSAGMSPLSLAVENGHFELAVMLLESGADPNDQRTGLAPLHRMIWVRKPDRGDSLDGRPPPIGSGNLDSLNFVRKLIEHGADVNLQLERSPKRFGKLNKKGATAFLMACKSADIPLMKLLLELGADPTLTNADDTPPLLVAAGIATQTAGEEAGSEPEAIEAIEMLLELGADINAVDRKKETAMHAAAYKNFPEVAKYLDAHGANIEIWNRPNSRGWTPLAIASGYRPGNFKPSAATIDAIRQIMVKNGVEPPVNPQPKRKLAKTP